MTNQLFTKEQLKSLPLDTLLTITMTLQNNVIELQKAVDQLSEQIRIMNQRTYGRKTEQATSVHQLQLEFVFNEPEVTIDDKSEVEEEPVIEQVVRKRTKGKKEANLQKITEHENEFVELSEEELEAKFGKNGWKKLPYEKIVKLEHIPAHFKVITYHIGVYASKKDNSTIIRANKPVELFEKSIVSPTLLASIMMGKFYNSVPLYRQEMLYKANNVMISRRAMASWIIRAYDRYLKYFYEAMIRKLLQQSILHADESPFLVTKDGREAGSKSYMWVYVGGIDANGVPIIIYVYCHTRGSENAKDFLEGFKGTLITDGYQAYHKLEKDNPDTFTVAGCWAHAKRKFSEITKSIGKKTKECTLAYEAEKKIQKIYHEDNKLTELTIEKRYEERQSKILPLVDEFFTWIKEQIEYLPSKSATAMAMAYSIRQEKYLRVFLQDARLPLDNNTAERKIRNFTIGRKNWVMVDTPSGAEASAAMYSIVETAKANNLKVFDYLTYLLTELPKVIQDLNTTIPERLMPWSPELPLDLRKSQ